MSDIVGDESNPRVCVFAPAPLLTVSAEAANGDGDAEIHLHAGGQGFWVSRLLEKFDVDVVMCASFGGEAGVVVKRLVEQAGVPFVGVDTVARSGAYIHDRRSGERHVVATMAAATLSRHEVDDLYDVTLIEALASKVTVLTGPQQDVVPDDVYRRLASDVGSAGGTVVADLSGGRLEAALAGGVDLLKVSEEELTRDGRLDATGSLVGAITALTSEGAGDVAVTRGDAPTLASIDGRLYQVSAPRLQAVDPRGAGDSFTAAAAAAIAMGWSVTDALSLGAAAGALNVTRRGLGSGRGDLMERLATLVSVTPLAEDGST